MQGKDSVQGYFPAGTWYSLMGSLTVDASEAGRPVTLRAPLGDVPVHVLGGTIVPMQARSRLSPLRPTRPTDALSYMLAAAAGLNAPQQVSHLGICQA